MIFFGSPQFRKLIFVAGHLVAMALLYYGVIAPIKASLSEGQANIQQQVDLLARYRNVAEQNQNMEALKAKIATQGSGEEFLTGTNEGVVNASLQAQLKAIAEKSGAQLRSIRTLPARIIGSTSYSGARVEISGPLRTIQANAYWVEANRPMMMISAAILRSNQGMGQDPAFPVEPQIESQFDVYAPAQFKATP